MDSFEQASAANQWVQDTRKLAIVTGYMKDAAAAWATAAMAAEANQITGFSENNAATDFKDHFLEKFTLTVSKINGITNSLPLGKGQKKVWMNTLLDFNVS